MLFDPQLSLQKAVFKALSEAQISYQGNSIPVFEFVPTESPNDYILISQQAVIPASGTIACRRWECTLLLDIVTKFPAKNQASSLPASHIAEQVISVLLDKRLVLDGEFGMSPAQLSMSQSLVDNVTGEYLDVHRYLRFQFYLEQHNQ